MTWNANYCCLEPSAFPSGVPLYNCDGSCGCGGCAVGTYTCRFEGFELSFPDWPCGCPHVSPDEPHRPGEKDPEERGAFASASFSASAVVFEDAYEDAPRASVARRATVTEEGGEGPVVSEATLTAVRVLMSPFVEAPENDCPWRHRYGVGEQVGLFHAFPF